MNFCFLFYVILEFILTEFFISISLNELTAIKEVFYFGCCNEEGAKALELVPPGHL